MKYLVSGLAILSTLTFSGCAPKPIKDVNQVAKQLKESGGLQSHWFEHGAQKIHYVTRGKKGAPVVTFLHGTPGNWEMFAHQLDNSQLLDNAYLVAIDRPGWGQSDVNADNLYSSLKVQAELIAPLLAELKEQSDSGVLVVAGHSLGATLAPYVAMLYPDLIDASVSYAGDLTSQYLEKQWYNELVTWMVVRAVLPQMLLDANEEVLSLPQNLDKMAKLWPTLNSPFIVYQGGEDGLVDKRNADFAKALETRSTVEVNYLPEHDHFIHLVEHPAISQRLVQLVEELQNPVELTQYSAP